MKTTFILNAKNIKDDIIINGILDTIKNFSKIGIDVNVICSQNNYTKIKTSLLDNDNNHVVVVVDDSITEFKDLVKPFLKIGRYRYFYIIDPNYLFDDEVFEMFNKIDILDKLNTKHDTNPCMIDHSDNKFYGGSRMCLNLNAEIEKYCVKNLYKKNLIDYLNKIKSGK